MSSSKSASPKLEYTSETAISNKYTAVQNGYASGQTRELEFRKDQLRNLYFAIKDHDAELKQALKVDLHRSEYETETLELNLCLAEIVNAIKNIDEWAADTTVGYGDIRFAMTKSVLRKTPYGVVLIIGPWNYPYLCTIGPVVAAIAAGNTVVLKPTEVAEESAKVLTKVMEKAFSSSVLQVVNGSIAETTQLLNQRWDRIMLTGSGRVGQVVAAAACKNGITPITLELGGKSPAIITASADLKTAAKRLAWAKFVNAGQTCIAPDYIIIDRSIADKFEILLQAAIKDMYPDIAVTRNEGRDYAHIVSDRLWERADKLVNDSKGRVWQYGEPNRETRFFPPTLVRDVTFNDSLMADELFGPIFPMVEVDNATLEAPMLVSKHDYPLALYIFSTKKQEQEYLLNRTRSGAVMINDALQQGGSPEIPFGGVGNSGVGRYHGKWGFNEFTYERPVVVQPTWAEKLIEARKAPYSALHAKLIRFVSVPSHIGFKRTGKIGKRGFIFWLFNLLVKKLGYTIFIIILFLYVR